MDRRIHENYDRVAAAARLNTSLAKDLITTVGRLKQRIDDRFPDSGLGRLCDHLHDISRQASEGALWNKRPSTN